MLAMCYVFWYENKWCDCLCAEKEACGELLIEFDEFAYVNTVDEDGNPVKKKVNKFFLNITDKENFVFC